MPQCPVCQTFYDPSQTQYCMHCGWHLIDVSPLVLEQLPEEYQNSYHIRLKWAQRTWAKFQAASNAIQTQLHQGSQEREEIKEAIASISNQLQSMDTSLVKVPTLSTSAKKTSPPHPPVDFKKLQKHLKAGNWQEADWETARMIIKVVGREKQGYLAAADLEKCPCRILEKIDRLWLTASKGRFSLSYQKQLYTSLGGTRFVHPQIWQKFATQMGWYQEERWLKYDELTFSEEAPVGHLPVLGDSLVWFVGGWGGGSQAFSALISRLSQCKIGD